MISFKKSMLFACATVALFAAPLVAVADYPDKPVSFVVPWPPGDLEDIITRMIAEDFQKKYDVPAAVVNKPGGGGGPFPGAVEVAKAPADGYTVGSFIVAVPVIGPNIGIPELTPNPFEPLGSFLTYPFIIVAGKDAPYDDIDGLAAHAKKNDVVLGHYGAPLIPTKVTFALAKAKDINYSSEAAFDVLDCNSLASGDVDVMNTTIQSVLPCINDVKVLASIGDERISLTPDTPTVGELVPELGISLWNGLFVHKDTPADVREKLIEVAKATVLSDAAQKLATDTGALIYWHDVEKTNERMEKDAKSLGVINESLK